MSGKGDEPDFLPLANDIDDGLVAVGFKIPDLQAANLRLLEFTVWNLLDNCFF
jgi:hypothetical protein